MILGKACTRYAATAKSRQSCPTPSDPMDCSPPGPSIQTPSCWEFPGKSTGVGGQCPLRIPSFF